MHTVAVYGSLLSGMGNHRLLESSQKIGSTLVTGFDMYSFGAFPVIVPGERDKAVSVEVYQVDKQTFERLDRLEGYPSFYDRQQVEVNFHDGVRVAWIYFMAKKPQRNLLPVPSGSWKEHRDVY